MGIPFVLDVAIGLIFIYLILSLLASELQELLTTLFQWRAKHLRDSIEVFLAGGSDTPEAEQVKTLVSDLYDDPLLKNINQESKSFIAKSARGITRWLIPGNRKGAFGTQQSTGPSYIASETFSTSLIERLGMSTLARKLVEVRLEKFAVRIVGGFKVQEGDASVHGWEKGRIRLIAEKAKKDLTSDANFTTLVEEYADILHDFRVEATTLTTCVERMGESLDAYIATYPLPNAQSAEPVTIATAAMEVPQGVDPAVSEPEPPASTNGEDLVYFAKRLRAFKLSLFGQKGTERAILSGGLRPSLSEIAQLVDESSTTYQEVAQSYKTLLEKAIPLEAQINPELEAQLLEAYPDAIEKEIVQAYPETVEEQLVAIAPDIFKTVEKQLTNQRRKTYRARLNPQANLLKQQRRTLHKAMSQLGAEQRQQVMSAVLNQFSGDERTLIINKSLEELSNEQRYAVINIAFINVSKQLESENKPGLTNADRSVYDNYQTYKVIHQALGKLPNSIKESFSILARRAQSKVQQVSHDVSQFREEVDVWFDRSMERASGVYKRNAKGVAILIGLALAGATNSDAFFIVNRLSNDENLRKVITDQAAQLPTKNPSATVKPLDQELKDLRQQTDTALNELTLPIGWKPENLVKQFECEPPISTTQPDTTTQPNPAKLNSPACNNVFFRDKQTSDTATSVPDTATSVAQLIASKPIDLLKLVIGWIISGLAIAMGAPFWFDLLGKVMNVRNSGSKPPSPETKETAK